MVVPTGMQGHGDKTIYDILKTGKLHGVVRCPGVNFGIVADSTIDPIMFAKASAYFHDVYMELMSRRITESKGETNVQGR